MVSVTVANNMFYLLLDMKEKFLNYNFGFCMHQKKYFITHALKTRKK